MEVSYTFPDDSPATAVLLFGAEFLETHPNRETVLYTGTHRSIMSVVCDTCGGRIAETEPCALSNKRLYCWRCFQHWIEPYITKVEL